MKLSVCIITFNHENFIKDSIDSILKQNTSFNFEIVIGDDASTDHTRKKILKFQEKYPERIKLILHDKNVGMMQNFIKTLNACSGNYIAVLEGDDYWTDPNKLQKQVDFLDSNPEFVMSSTAYVKLDENSKNITDQKDLFTSDVITIEDMLENNYVSTLTCVFRNNLFNEFPAGFCDLKVGDWPLHILNAQYGKIKYFGNWVTGVYRVHDSGVWSKEKLLNKYIAYAEVFEFLKKNLDKKYHAKLDHKIVEFYYSAVSDLYKKGSYKKTDPYIDRIISIKGKFSKENLKLQLKRILK